MKTYSFAALLIFLAAVLMSLKNLCNKLLAVDHESSALGSLAARAVLEILMNLLADGISQGRQLMKRRGDGASTSCSCDVRTISGKSCFFLFVRSLAGCGSSFLEQLCLKVVPLATASLIFQSSPIFVAAWSLLLFRESVPLYVVFFMFVCCCGLTLTLEPWKSGKDAYSGGLGYGLLCFGPPILTGLCYIALRQLKPIHHRIVIHHYMGTMLILSLLFGLILGSLKISLDEPKAVLAVVGYAACDYFAEVCITIGFAQAQEASSHVSALKFISPVLSQVWGVVFLHESLSALHLIGAAIVLISAAAIVVSKAARERQDSRAGADTSLQNVLSQSEEESQVGNEEKQ